MQGTRALCGAQSSNMAPNNHECFFPPLHFLFFFFFRSADRRELPINERTRHACCRRFFFPFSNNFFFFFFGVGIKTDHLPLCVRTIYSDRRGVERELRRQRWTHTRSDCCCVLCTRRLPRRVFYRPIDSPTPPAYILSAPNQQPAASLYPIYIWRPFFSNLPPSLSLSLLKNRSEKSISSSVSAYIIKGSWRVAAVS